MHYYACHGLVIASDIILQLYKIPPCEKIDVSIRYSSESLFHNGATENFSEKNHFYLNVKSIAAFHVFDGREIIVFPYTSDENIISIFIYGSCFGALLKQRGKLVLHANAIQVGNKAILVAGEQRAGKSTLTGAFFQKGHRVLADDVCVVQDHDNTLRVLPGTPFIKLTQYSIEQLNIDLTTENTLGKAYEKWRINLLEKSYFSTPLEISAFFEVIADEINEVISANTLSGLNAFSAIHQHIYRPHYPIADGHIKTHAQTLFRFAQNMRVYQLRRPANRFTAFALAETITDLAATSHPVLEHSN